MGRGKRRRAAVPARVLGMALAVHLSQDVAPGSGLKLAGLLATASVALAAWRLAVWGVDEAQTRRLSAVLCGMVGLLAWPVWSVGVLPSVNGAVLRDAVTVEMWLERTEATTKSRSRELNHWAWVVGVEGAPQLQAARYFIPKATFDRLEAERPATVTVEVATGLLGAVVVTAIR